ncbi:MAG: hypothetical protein BAJALOKI3v1_90030 [Promethearchaeota archaeon]|jgi:uncharacterized protein (UPF0218 family)|nr:MAG: hypothetical protein BAJALOKI3v1_90030 [Candidatus Lokiarchaeota archaeon]
MNEKLKIPEDKRHLFAQPLDTLISGTREETIPKVVDKFRKLKIEGNNFNFYIVGDIVAQDFLANDFLRSYIRLCIIDEKTQRKNVQINGIGFFEEIRTLKNPKGTISKHSWDVLEQIISLKKRVLLKITEGEEDLLVLPLISLLPLDEQIPNFVFYGQPPITDSVYEIPEGIVVVNITKKIKKTVNKFLKFMDRM